MNRDKLISPFNTFNQSFDETKSYFLYSNNKQNSKKIYTLVFIKRKIIFTKKIEQ